MTWWNKPRPFGHFLIVMIAIVIFYLCFIAMMAHDVYVRYIK
jgi:hypothetical protein